ncbi:hypothetical protein GCM10011322_26510 [Salinarimonas ramus]|uniref:Uncharacterized protein n=1 Tax=Salinarimonas ramus TaxID=690164 RepID=A0A917Q9R0_9HYPH|nr:hypothetical protein GCM10011322_26510 [Salinarimonas ramus]
MFVILIAAAISGVMAFVVGLAGWSLATALVAAPAAGSLAALATGLALAYRRRRRGVDERSGARGSVRR